MAYISHYARGRDYHKLIRNINMATALSLTALLFSNELLRKKQALDGSGKIPCLLIRAQDPGSSLESCLPIFLSRSTNRPPVIVVAVQPVEACPTNAFVGPNILDATRCISYLTIESRGAIPEQFRNAIGNRIFGCDDCQLVCPWNKFSKPTTEKDFSPRHKMDNIELIDLFTWTEEEFFKNTEGSPIRRIGYDCWKRNIAIALGNADTSVEIIQVLKSELGKTSPMVREHIEWALLQHQAA